MREIWHRLFLEERSSIGLSFFRIAVALTTGFHVLPTFLPLRDNYLTGAFKTSNAYFFTPGVVEWVSKSPDGLVIFFVILFCLSWLTFLVGLMAQISCIVMTLCCYYFYALNAFHVGTLSWDILLVTLFLMCVCPYSGDYFSLDALRRGNPDAYRIKQPFFVQRLLQLQIACTYFYTGLYKITAEGNWLQDNPIYYLMNYPAAGVTKHFLLKEFMATKPALCYAVGVTIVAIELLMPFLLFYRRTRLSAIYLGTFFSCVLILTLDVPAIFFFLYPPQLLLFLNPQEVIRWIDQKRILNRNSKQAQLIFDGNCQFCQASVLKLRIMDLFGVLKQVDYQKCADIKQIHPQLSKEIAHSQLHLVEPDGTLYGGFWVFRRLCFSMPMLYPCIPLFYFPGMGVLGPIVYKWIANNRYLFHFNQRCKDNVCFR